MSKKNKNHSDSRNAMTIDIMKKSDILLHDYRFDQPFDRRQVTWIISFTDLMAIMLCFFVLIFSMSIPADETLVASEVFQNDQAYAPKNQDAQGFAGSNDAKNIALDEAAIGQNLDYIMTLLQGMVSALPESLQDKVALKREDRHIRILAPSIFSFPRDSVVADQKAYPLGRRLGLLLAGLQNEILIIGHISKAESETLEPSEQLNLGLARARSIASLINEGGVERDIQIKAFGRYVDNLETKLPQNQGFTLDILSQRVDVLIMGQAAR